MQLSMSCKRKCTICQIFMLMDQYSDRNLRREGLKPLSCCCCVFDAISLNRRVSFMKAKFSKAGFPKSVSYLVSHKVLPLSELRPVLAASSLFACVCANFNSPVPCYLMFYCYCYNRFIRNRCFFRYSSLWKIVE